MTAIKAHFDGNSIVLDEAISLKPNTRLTVLVNEEKAFENSPGNGEQSDLYSIFGEPFDTGIDDLAAEHDHYLYGTPKKHKTL